jgi:hypothetical protein
VKLRGRKFYWPQSDPQAAGKVWKFHLKDPVLHEKVESQLPPLIHALRDGTEFECRIHFRNLAPEELGAIVFALDGGDNPEHTLRVGKGKPRGLGNVRCEITGIAIDPSAETLLDSAPESPSIGDKSTYVADFKKWVEAHDKTKKFEQFEHIRSYVNLHKWKDGARQIRYYPINFNQYGWLPDERPGNTKGEPKYQRPEAMRPASQVR